MIDSITFGVNWYANDYAKLKLNYLRTMYDQSITINGVSHEHENALMVQFQIQF